MGGRTVNISYRSDVAVQETEQREAVADYGPASTPYRIERDALRGSSTRRRTVGFALVGLVAVAGVVAAVVACTGDGPSPGGAGENAAATQRARVETGPAVDVATGATVDADFPVVEDLVIEATGLADQLFEDPTVVNVAGDPTLARFNEIYTDDSPTPAGVAAQLRTLSANGQRYRPGPSGRLRDVGVYRMTRVDDSQVAFRICAIEDVEIVDATGTVIDRRSQVTQGDGWANRVGGEWRFAGIDPDENATLPIAPGSAPSGFCDQLLGGPTP
jgi:hypothetical protein